MNANQIFDSFLTPTGITALTTGALAVLSFLTQFRTARSQSLTKFRDLDERTKAIAYWQAWLAAQTQVCNAEDLQTAKTTVRNRLDELVSIIDERELSTNKRPIRQTLLLFRPHKGRWVWLVRTPFYVSLAWFVVYIVGSIIRFSTKTTSASDDFIFIISLTLFAVLAVIFRLIATASDADFRTQRASPRGGRQ